MKIDTLIKEQKVLKAPKTLSSKVMNDIILYEVLNQESTLNAPNHLKASIMREVHKEFKYQNAISRRAKISASLMTMSIFIWVLLSPENPESQRNYLRYFDQMDFGILKSLNNLEYNYGALFSVTCLAFTLLLFIDQKLRSKA